MPKYRVVIEFEAATPADDAALTYTTLCELAGNMNAQLDTLQDEFDINYCNSTSRVEFLTYKKDLHATPEWKSISDKD